MAIFVPVWGHFLFIPAENLKILESGIASYIGALLAVFIPWLLFSYIPALKQFAQFSFDLLRKGDVAIVRYGSYVVGTRYSGAMRRSIFLFLTLVIIAGIVLSNPLGAGVFLLVGLAAILVILRHWSHDEDERERRIDDKFKLVPTDEDLRYEAVFALALLFAIAPMGLSRLDSVYPIFRHEQGSAIAAVALAAFHYIEFSWYEFPHSVPIVHAFDVYFEGNPFADAGFTPLLRMATFSLRLAYEFFAASTLINLIKVGRRIANDEDMRPIKARLSTNNDSEHALAVTKLQHLAETGSFDALDTLAEIISNPSLGPSAKYSHRTITQARSALFAATEWLKEIFRALHDQTEEYGKVLEIGNSSFVEKRSQAMRSGDARTLDLGP